MRTTIAWLRVRHDPLSHRGLMDMPSEIKPQKALRL